MRREGNRVATVDKPGYPVRVVLVAIAGFISTVLFAFLGHLWLAALAFGGCGILAWFLRPQPERSASITGDVGGAAEANGWDGDNRSASVLDSVAAWHSLRGQAIVAGFGFGFVVPAILALWMISRELWTGSFLMFVGMLCVQQRMVRLAISFNRRMSSARADRDAQHDSTHRSVRTVTILLAALGAAAFVAVEVAALAASDTAEALASIIAFVFIVLILRARKP